MHRHLSDYDRILIGLASAVLVAGLLTGNAKAQEVQLDRYGGEMRPQLQPAPPLPRRAPPAMAAPLAAQSVSYTAPQPFAGRALSWAGKSYAAPEPAPAPAYAPPPQAYVPPPAPVQASAPPRLDRRAMRAARRMRRMPVVPPTQRAEAPAPVQAAAAPQPRPLPQSIYAPAPVAAAQARPAPQSAPQAVASAPRAAVPSAATMPPPRAPSYGSGTTIRRYSVHREFGMRPDPTPIPPQFFTSSADLSATDSAEAEPIARTPPAQAAVSPQRRGRIAKPAVAADPT